MGLLKTAAKVAVASSVHGRVQRRQQQRWAAQDATAAQAAGHPPAPYAVPAPANAAEPPLAPAAEPRVDAAAGQSDMGERLNQLTQLGDLFQAGVVTEAEFQEQKNRILHG